MQETPAAGPLIRPPAMEKPPGGVQIPFYIHPLWLALLTVAIGTWLYLTSWVSYDARGVGLDFMRCAVLMLAAGGLGLLLTVALHGAFAFFMLLIVLGAAAGYIAKRNEVVPERHRIFGSYHRSQLLKSTPLIGNLVKGDTGFEFDTGDVLIRRDDGTPFDDFMSERGGMAAGAEAVRNALLEACTANSREVRIFPHGDQFVVQHVLDGAAQNTQALKADVGNRAISSVAGFLGLTREGRPRTGSASLSAQVRGMPMVTVQVGIRSREGKPVLLMHMPDWTEDLYQAGLEALGMHEALVKRVRSALEQNRGAVVAAGPPHSGVTTTLYAVAGAVDVFTTDLMAVEDEQQHEMEQVRRYGLHRDRPFDEQYDEIMRQGPQALMFDDVQRDAEARLLLRFAAEQGKVLAGLHSKSAPAALLALAERTGNVDLVSRAVTCVTCQKLVRRLCLDCRQPVAPNPELLRKLDMDPAEPGEWF
ncbi:MAG: ATPase, T2SS/T4P/T4SS family, partial [Candidatus Brocadiia bacterium]